MQEIKGENIEESAKAANVEIPQKKVWDEIASGWSGWRHTPDAMIEKTAGEWLPGKILDAGCGNCRNLLPFAKKGFECHGIDFSSNMIGVAKQFCKEQGIKVDLKVADADLLPFKPNTFNYAISMAVIHHLDTHDKRMMALSEIRRVIKPGGKALISVWNKMQWKFAFKPQDLYVPWQRKGMEYMRYYHFFNHWELNKMIKSVGFRVLWFSGPFGRNLQYIVEKK
jgi:tRNA (uracil-5-)-methyltransferase TRM9